VHRKVVALAVAVVLGVTGCQATSSDAPAGPVDVSGSDTSGKPLSLADSAEDAGGDEAPAGFDRQFYSLDDPASLWVIVNKARPLNPQDFEPENLRAPAVKSAGEPVLQREAAAAIEEMFAQAEAEEVSLVLQSSYRSFSVQERVKARSVARSGQEISDAQSARPGHSEHQTGLAADVVGVSGSCALRQCFGETPEGRWIAENSWKFGFIVRYGDGQTAITGYSYEPWHVRFVGKDLAAEIWRQGNPALEEFFGLDPAPDYLD
jgi:zinc D-Ala-D-Ala carboxypeptidase